MDFIFSLMMVGSLSFWLFIALIGVILIANIQRESVGWSTFVVVLTLTALQITSDFKPFTWISQNPVQFIIGAGCYLLLSVVWTTIKWYLFTLQAKEYYGQIRGRFIKDLGRDFDVTRDKVALSKAIYQSSYSRHFGSLVPPSAHENKSRIILWMVFWPLDAVWSIINDPVVRIFQFIYRGLSGSLHRISQGRFRNFEELN